MKTLIGIDIPCPNRNKTNTRLLIYCLVCMHDHCDTFHGYGGPLQSYDILFYWGCLIHIIHMGKYTNKKSQRKENIFREPSKTQYMFTV